MKCADIVSVRERKDTANLCQQSLIKEDVEQKRGKNAPLKDTTTNTNSKVAARRVADRRGVSKEHTGENTDRGN